MLQQLYKKMRHQEHGSMTVEAAMVLPIFLFFVIFLIYMIQMVYTLMALQLTVSNTAKQLAAHLYPVSIVMDRVAADSGTETGNRGSLTMEEVAQTYDRILPPPIGDWVKNTELYRRTEDAIYQAAGDTLVKPLLKPYLQEATLREDRIHVTRFAFPNLKTKSNVFVALELSYTMPMRIPFLNTELVIRTRAAERAWIGDTSGAGAGTGSEGATGQPQIVGMEPNPMKPGSNATVRVKVQPNQKVQVVVYYKSGKSTAKYLGEKTADAEGNVAWTWRVSGNTTKGSTVQIVIETEDGQKTEMQVGVQESMKEDKG
ncbi:TadE/TadG family type IV pilus assembly protein [Paenibacillus guangzhouensis]|uniref:TadE/TadG family type IV pilus assembly protein n=1 Tax=Paenibacillus guangzhouensis TaxID=1473112 RepID=UPI00126742E7|nr:TadE/TadG family type IV pilus assembly protein [Paenibacillus guangzhouensis]